MRTVGGWNVEVVVGSAHDLHHADLPTVRTVRLMQPTRPALVLGSSQDDAVVDAAFCRAHGLDVVRRRSGGGAVHIDPTDTVWVDFFIPRGDPLWLDDVGAAMHWAGRVWRDALETAGVTGLSVHTGGFVANDWSPTLCFAGVGAGEVFLDGRKVVGISQRRTREVARFQCSAHRAWNPDFVAATLPSLAVDLPRLASLVECVPAGFASRDVLAVLPP